MHGKVILLVEDDPSDIDLTRRAFEKSQIGSELVVAQDGEEALDYLFGLGAWAGRTATVSPAVILLDLKLPGIDGLEVLKRIRADERTRWVPVVILSSSDERREIGMSYDLGANSYVRKPVDFNRFVETVRQLDLYWLELNEPPPPRR